MMISLLQTAGSARVLEKAAHMAEVDPHGFILTIVSVAVVFSALILLFIAYSITGALFTKDFKTLFSGLKKRSDASDPDEAAAVALAIDLYLSEQDCSEEQIAAIATALHLYLDAEAVHDNESGIITIKRQ